MLLRHVPAHAEAALRGAATLYAARHMLRRRHFTAFAAFASYDALLRCYRQFSSAAMFILRRQMSRFF